MWICIITIIIPLLIYIKHNHPDSTRLEQLFLKGRQRTANSQQHSQDNTDRVLSLLVRNPCLLMYKRLNSSRNEIQTG